MDLLEIGSPDESKQISDFLSSQCKYYNWKLVRRRKWIIINFLALGYASIFTQLQPLGISGETNANNIAWSGGEPSGKGDCTSFNKLGFSMVPCEEPRNFMCEAKNTDTA